MGSGGDGGSIRVVSGMSDVGESGGVVISSGEGSSLGGSGLLSLESGDVSGLGVSSGGVSLGSGDSEMGFEECLE